MHPVVVFPLVPVERNVMGEAEVETDEPSDLRGIPGMDNQVYAHHLGYNFDDRDLAIGDLH